MYNGLVFKLVFERLDNQGMLEVCLLLGLRVL